MEYKDKLMMLNLKELKAFIKGYNLQMKIVMTKKKKEELIAEILKHTDYKNGTVIIKSHPIEGSVETKPKVVKPKKEVMKVEPKKEVMKEESEVFTFDKLAYKLQQILITAKIDDIINALKTIGFKGKLQSNRMLMNLQIMQNVKSMEQMKKLLELLEPKKK
jgi:hypothetical protein